MWSDEARAAAAEARKKGHSSKGNRDAAKHVKKQHDQVKKKDDEHKSVIGGVAKGALIGSIVPGVGTVAGALIGGAMRISHNSAIDANHPKVKAAIRAADAKKRKKK